MISKRRSRRRISSQNPDLLLGEAVADAAMDAGPECEMLPRLLAIDDELVRALDLVVVAVAGDGPYSRVLKRCV